MGAIPLEWVAQVFIQGELSSHDKHSEFSRVFEASFLGSWCQIVSDICLKWGCIIVDFFHCKWQEPNSVHLKQEGDLVGLHSWKCPELTNFKASPILPLKRCYQTSILYLWEETWVDLTTCVQTSSQLRALLYDSWYASVWAFLALEGREF